jgi:hypothetical protein
MKIHTCGRLLIPLLGLFLILFFQPAKAQLFKGYGAAGLNMAQVDGDEVYGYKKIAGNLGVGVMIPFKEKWHVSLETSFSQKGAKGRPGRIIAEYDHYDLRLNYAEVPLLVHYTDKQFFTIGTGFSWGRLVGINELEDGVNTEIEVLDDVFKRDDFGVLIDLRFPIYQRLKFNFRYQYSMSALREREFTNIAGSTRTRQYYNNLLSFRLIYMFNENLSKLRQKNN